MEVPRLGVEWGLQLPAYTVAHSSVASLTHRARPGIEPASSWIRVGFDTAEPRWELPPFLHSSSYFKDCILWPLDEISDRSHKFSGHSEIIKISSSPVSQQFKDTALVAVVAWVRSLALELPRATGVAKKKKKKKKPVKN